MIKIGFVKPVEVGIVTSGDGIGKNALEPETDISYDVFLDKAGDELLNSGRLYINSKGGSWVAGEHVRQVTPETFTPMGNIARYDEDGNIFSYGSILPRDFYRPMEVKYSYDGFVRYGQSSKGSYDYRMLKFKGENLNFNQNIKGARFISFNNDLYLLCEMTVESLGQICVHLFRQSAESGEFELVKVFSEIPVDSINMLDGQIVSQIGSPDGCEIDDHLVIVYRSVVREGDGGYNNIVTYRIDKDFSRWEKSVTPVDGSITCDYDILTSSYLDNPMSHPGDQGFRLRVASGGGSICLAWCGRKTYVDTNSEHVATKKEMRTFMSSDMGRTFIPNEDGYSALSTVDDTYYESERFTGLTQMFVVKGDDPRRPAEDTEVGHFNVNFALYYDKNMASFVIMKPGDSRGEFDNDGNDCGLHMVGIRTVRGDFTKWEICLDIVMSSSLVAPVGNYAAIWNERGRNPNIRIHDIDIAPGETINDLFLLMKVRKMESFLQSWTEGEENVLMAQTEFTFVNKNIYRQGLIDAPYVGIGGKWHEDYLFSMAPLNPYASGVASLGWFPRDPFGDFVDEDLEFDMPVLYNLSATRHAEQLIVTAYPDNPKGVLAYAISSGVSELPDMCDYKFKWSADFGPLDKMGWEFIEGYGYDYYGFYPGNILDLSNVGYSHEIHGEDSGGGTYYTNDELIDGDNFQIKFRIGLYDFPDKEYIPLRIYGGTDLFVSVEESSGRFVIDLYVGGNPHLIGETATSGGWLDVIIKVTKEVTEGGSLTTIGSAFRLDGELWQQQLVGFFQGLNFGKEIRFGCVNDSMYNETFLKSIQVGSPGGSPGSRFEPVFANRRGSHVGWGYPEVGSIQSGFISAYSNEIDLIDGTRLILEGARLPGGTDRFNLINVSPGSDIRVLNDGLTNAVYRLPIDLEEYSILFNNVGKQGINAVSLFNIHGCHSVRIRALNIKNNIEATVFEQEFEIPSDTIYFAGDALIDEVEGEEFINNEFKSKSIILYDNAEDEYLEHYKSISNSSESMLLDRDINYSYDLYDLELRVMDDATTFILQDESIYATHFEVTFLMPEIKEAAYIGEVVFGRYIDMSQDVSEFDKNIYSNFDIIESSYGRLYPSMSGPGNHAISATITCPLIGRLSEHRLFNIINSIHKTNKPFPIVSHTERGDVSELALFSDSWVDSPSGRFREVGIDLLLHRWQRNVLSSKEIGVDVVTIVAPANAEVNESVEFKVVINNPLGLDIKCLWDFGSGETAETDLTQVNFTFDEPGEKFIQLLVYIGEDVIYKSLSIYVV